MSQVAPTVEKLSFPETVGLMEWQQGEHVTLIAPTGRGKTELTVELLRYRTWAIFLGTKRRDSTQDRLRRMGWRTIATSEELNPEIASKFILRPPFPKGASAGAIRSHHRDVFRSGLMRAYHQTGWCVAIDEGRYIADFLGLKDEMSLLWLQGRSQDNTVICATQRPRWIPLEAYDQASHLFLWSSPDHEDMRRLSDFIPGVNSRDIYRIMRRMRKHDVLYVNPVTGDTVITNTRWG